MKSILVLFLALLLVQCNPYNLLSKSKQAKYKQDYHSRHDMFKAIAQKMNLSPKDTICDVAAGSGVSISLLANYLPPATTYYEEDIKKDYCNKTAFNNTFKFYQSQANIHNFYFKIGTDKSIPFATNSFSNIALFISLHEFSYKEQMLQEVTRIMRDTGKLYLLETVYLHTPTVDENCHFTYLSEKELYRLIDAANLKITFDDTFGEKKDTANVYTRFLVCEKK